MNTVKRIFRHNSIDFPFELAHENSRVNVMKEFHWHSFFEISYVTRGSGIYYIENKVIPVAKGDFLIVNNMERHRVEYTVDDPLYETVFHFDRELLSNVFQESFNIFDYDSDMFNNKLTPSPENRRRLEEIIDSIVDEYNHKDSCYKLIIVSQLIHFVAIAYRSGCVYKRTAVQTNNNYEMIVRFEAILKFIAKHLESELTAQDVAKKFYLNPSYFSVYFKKMMGITYTEYVRELRISKAIRLLEKGNRKIIDIALMCGFSSVSAFYNAFSKVHGMSPQKYIAQKKKNFYK